MEKRRREARPKQFEEEIINIGRVTKVTKGGRHFRFSATVAVGDRKGQVGIGTGKANEVPDAIKKAVQAATKNVVRVSIVDGTIPHYELVHQLLLRYLHEQVLIKLYLLLEHQLLRVGLFYYQRLIL